MIYILTENFDVLAHFEQVISNSSRFDGLVFSEDETALLLYISNDEGDRLLQWTVK